MAVMNPAAAAAVITAAAVAVTTEPAAEVLAIGIHGQSRVVLLLQVLQQHQVLRLGFTTQLLTTRMAQQVVLFRPLLNSLSLVARVYWKQILQVWHAPATP